MQGLRARPPIFGVKIRQPVAVKIGVSEILRQCQLGIVREGGQVYLTCLLRLNLLAKPFKVEIARCSARHSISTLNPTTLLRMVQDVKSSLLTGKG